MWQAESYVICLCMTVEWNEGKTLITHSKGLSMLEKGDLLCAITGHPITHSNIHLNESSTGTSHLCSHISFMFPTQTSVFLSRQHLYYMSLSHQQASQDCCDHFCFSSFLHHSREQSPEQRATLYMLRHTLTRHNSRLVCHVHWMSFKCWQYLQGITQLVSEEQAKSLDCICILPVWEIQ